DTEAIGWYRERCLLSGDRYGCRFLDQTVRSGADSSGLAAFCGGTTEGLQPDGCCSVCGNLGNPLRCLVYLGGIPPIQTKSRLHAAQIPAITDCIILPVTPHNFLPRCRFLSRSFDNTSRATAFSDPAEKSGSRSCLN